jgi:DNA-binding beta-propeller fold protein YncE
MLFCGILAFLSPASALQSTGSKELPASSRSSRSTAPAQDGVANHVVNHGIAVDLKVSPVHPPLRSQHSLHAGEDVVIQLGVHDAETGSPLTGLHPSAWLSLLNDSTSVPCKAIVQSFLGASVPGPRPDLDMNAYYVAAMNDDSTITVVDPQFASGKSRLVSLIKLDGRGEDWALNASQTRLYISTPDASEVAEINTADWKIVYRTPVAQAARLALQPDEHYLWAGYEGLQSGMAVLRASDLTLMKLIPLGKGPHDVAFSSDNRFAFITSKEAGSIAVIDISRLKVLRELKISGQPFQIGFSPIAQSAYAIDSEHGVIFAISANRQEIASQIHAEPGLTQISFPGDGHLGFVLNPDKGKVHILDVARNQIIQTAAIDKTPTEISFSDQLAYVLRKDTELVEVIPLERVGKPDTPVSVVDLPGSSAGSSSAIEHFTTLVAQIPGENAVVIASPKDKAVYYYDEGMAAPMGIFGNFGKEPRAVMVIDRSLREQQPGMYGTSVRLEKSGVYTLPIAITSPPIVECFQVPVEPATSAH